MKSGDTLGDYTKDRTNVQMLGATVEEVGGLVAAEDKKRTEEILRNRETQARVRQVNSPSL